MTLDALRISTFIVVGGALFPRGLTIDTSTPIEKKAGNTVNDPVKITFADIVIEEERKVQERNFI